MANRPSKPAARARTGTRTRTGKGKRKAARPSARAAFWQWLSRPAVLAGLAGTVAVLGLGVLAWVLMEPSAGVQRRASGSSKWPVTAYRPSAMPAGRA